MKIQSFRSPKTEVRKSETEGRGLYARKPISKGEIVSIKGGYILDKQALEQYQDVVGDSDLQIADNFYLAPSKHDEKDSVMMFLNHSCEPNVGVAGNVIFVTMRDIAPGEELRIDYAMIDDYDGDPMTCNCGAQTCRKVITGKDWQKKELQLKYGNYFSWYLLEKISHN